jgi:serine phosphatase RsbU (regulator of sigma subunit)/PAS domain-containing protein
MDVRDLQTLAERRLATLARLSKLGQERMDVQDTVNRVCDVLVPELADVCIVDVVRIGVPQRLAARASGPGAGEHERFLLMRGPEPPSAQVSFTAQVSGGEPVLLERIADPMFIRWARDSEDLAALRALDASSGIVLPLLSREQVVGVLTLLMRRQSGRFFDGADVEFVTLLAGRVALTLDNAGLSSQLGELERRLAATLGSLVEAVMIQDASGRIVFANAAAAELAGLPPGSRLSGDALSSGLTLLDENSRAIGLQDLPAARVMAGEADVEPMLLRALSAGTRQERWLLAKAAAMPVEQEVGAGVGAVGIFEDVTRWQRVELARRVLAQVSGVLSSVDPQQALGEIVRITSAALADWCTVSMPDEAGRLRRAAVAITDERRTPLVRMMLQRSSPGAQQRGADAEVFGEARARMINAISDETLAREVSDEGLRELLVAVGLGAVIMVPLLTAGRCIGVMTLCRTRTSAAFAETDLALAEEVGRRAGNALEASRLYTERMRVTSLLQRALRPPVPAVPTGWSVATLYEPSGDGSEVGGDFYDVFAVPGGHMAIIGDVTGHGALAARLTAAARHTLRTAGELTGDPIAAMAQLNRTLCGIGELALATAACVLVRERERGRGGAGSSVIAEIVAGGHPLPILTGPGGTQTVGREGMLLGWERDARWELSTQPLGGEDTLILYTDGVTDARRGRESFGEERLLSFVAQAPAAPQGLVAALQRTLQSFRSGPRRDDVAALALQVGSGDG